MSVFLSGCAQTSGNFCKTEKPYYLTKNDLTVMTETQKKFHLSRNEYGAKLCGWKPANG